MKRIGGFNKLSKLGDSDNFGIKVDANDRAIGSSLCFSTIDLTAVVANYGSSSDAMPGSVKIDFSAAHFAVGLGLTCNSTLSGALELCAAAKAHPLQLAQRSAKPGNPD